MWKILYNFARILKFVYVRNLENHSLIMPKSSFGAVLQQYSNHGTENVQSLTERLRVSPTNGELPLTCSLWFLETWETTPQQEWPFQETLQQVRINSMESGLSMLRERML